ncbi:flagellar basal-body rod protein FlgC [Planomonospora parontospora subsp. parontospora]|uniref:Flagellar basal-body rod protein FlgC n=2 Tax=Planomonospora parontospora TaxID=58119 RepID=A0AA37BNP7_9ACTN|nr:flagellar basal body rod C-terminal domain-containing protein [Planomonospora parontospora]GGK96284.1 flagellar basal-body rod protein FlgC [Planomonospora parontospora]GII12741.1 flagellar basal-body rod protein FlgC [Planomonospora parontospora subsp. parontospora]
MSAGGPFRAIGIAGTGVTVYRKWLDAVSDNIANINNAAPTSGEAFRARYVTAQAVDYGSGTGGVQVGGIELGSGEGRLVHEPDNPLADENGYVRYPDIDLGAQMGQLMMAQRAYQANISVVDRAYDAYQAALQLGRNG